LLPMSTDQARITGTILVVDDDEAILQTIKTILSECGHTVLTARDGTKGLAAAEQTSPDLILMDVVMPEMDGYETTRRLRERPHLKNVPVIFLSGRSTGEDAGRSFAHGGLTFVRKPFSTQQLTDLVALTLQSLDESGETG